MKKEKMLYGIIMPEPEKFIQICQEVIHTTPKIDEGGAWYIDNYKLKNGLLMDIEFYPPMPYSVVDREYNGVFFISVGPEGAWSDKKVLKQKHANTFTKFKKFLIKALNENNV